MTSTDIVQNLSDLTPAMRRALLQETASHHTANALQRRGLISSRDLGRDGCYPLNLTEAGRRAAAAIRAEGSAASFAPGTLVRNTINGLVGRVARVERSSHGVVVVLVWDGAKNETCGSATYLEVIDDESTFTPVTEVAAMIAGRSGDSAAQEILREAQEDPQGAEDRAERGAEAALFDAVQRHAPAATDVARYVAQLRRWAAEDLPEGDDWRRGRASAFAMVADQLERNVLGGLAPLLAAEAARRVATSLGEGE